MNPTTEDYRYIWTELKIQSIGDIPIFQCLTECGLAQRGKQTDMTFTCVPEDVGIFESFWLFKIPTYEIDTVFLLVANVNEPSVCCSKTRLTLEPTVLGKFDNY